MARKMAAANINLLVIDTENKFVGSGKALAWVSAYRTVCSGCC
jgi:Mg-chelatase subunit ChlD